MEGMGLGADKVIRERQRYLQEWVHWLTQLATDLSIVTTAALVKSVMDQNARGGVSLIEVPNLQRHRPHQLPLFPVVGCRRRLQGIRDLPANPCPGFHEGS
ncbi:hypothetical protein MLD38_009425 [Melastoma candidum]|uniref:Uncharacterized protein n=1 Tax=Melastoma candidum TaxID=119954 RepID=A0ACB9RYU2_9MYRT|nr:hypothetical protein MLD38_009425 [Melastoma candidum]